VSFGTRNMVLGDLSHHAVNWVPDIPALTKTLGLVKSFARTGRFSLGRASIMHGVQDLCPSSSTHFPLVDVCIPPPLLEELYLS
jgi:hypothetical protein